MSEITVGRTRLVVVQGDITMQAVDAVVNAANSTLLGGGGVDGAIHRRGGPRILEACRRLRAGPLNDGLSVGDAVTTTAGDLPARRVIHTVGPVWRGGAQGEAERLASAWATSLDRAREEGLRTIAFPSISTGAYGYPMQEAADVAIATVIRWLRAHDDAIDEVRLVQFSGDAMAVWRAALERARPT